MGNATQASHIFQTAIDWLTRIQEMSPVREERRRTRALLASVLILTLMSALGGLANHVLIGPDSTSLARFMFGLGVLLYVAMRFLTGAQGKYLTITVSGLLPYLVLIMLPTDYRTMLSIGAPLVTVMLAALLLPVRAVMLTAFFNICSMTLLLFITAGSNTQMNVSYFTTGLSAITLSVLGAIITERNQNWQANKIEALQMQQAQWQTLMDSLPEALLIHARGIIIYANRSAAQLMGAPRTESLSGQQLRHWFPDIQSIHTPRIQRDSSDQVLSLRYPEIFRKTEQTEILLDIIETPIYFQDRLATLMSIRQASELAENPYAELLLMQKAGLRPALLVCREERIVFAGQAAHALLKRDADALSELHLSDCVIPAHHSRLAAQQSMIVQLQGPEGPLQWALLKRSPVEFEAHTADLIMIEPLDKLGEASLSAEWLLNFVKPLAEATLIVRHEPKAGLIVRAGNPALRALLGYEVAGQSLSALLEIPPTLDLLSVLQQCDARQQSIALNMYGEDGQSVLVDCLVSRFQELGRSEDSYLLMQTDVTLRENHKRLARLEKLLHETPYACHVDTDNRLRLAWVGGRFEGLTGYTEAELLRLPGAWEALVLDSDRHLLQNRHRQMDMSQPYQIEYRIKRRDGVIHWVQDAVKPILDASQSRVVMIEGSLRDISSRMNAEEALRTHVVQQAVVADLGMLALMDHAQYDLINHTLLLIEQVLDLWMCEVWEYLPEAHVLQLMSDTGYPADAPRRLSLNPEDNQAAYVLSTREPLMVHNPLNEGRFKVSPHHSEQGLMNSCSVLVYGHEQPFGVINVYADQQRRFTDDDIYFLQSVANVLGASIEQKRSQEAERKQRDFADALRDSTAMINSKLELPEVLSRILAFVAQAVPSHEASMITLLDETGQYYRYIRSLGYPSDRITKLEYVAFRVEETPVLRRMIEERRSIIIPDTTQEPDWVVVPASDWVRSYLGAPIFLDNQCIGVIHVNSHHPDTFNEADAERVMAFANKTGLAILNARRTEELERRVMLRTDELKIQREQVQAILDATGEGIIYIEDGRIRFVNRAMCALTGFDLEDFVGQTLKLLSPRDLTVEENQMFGQLYEAGPANSIRRGELRLSRADGSHFIAGLTISHVSIAPQKSVTIVRDISREKELESFKTRFIANAAHELRSPITNLNTRLYLIRKKPEQIDEHMGVLERVVIRMNRLVSDLLDMAYLEHARINLHREVVILQEVVSEVVGVQMAEAERKSIRLEQEDSTLPLHILGDPHRLMQVFTNLIVNAITYTPDGGQIIVTTLLLPEEKLAQIRICDSGQGIDAQDAENIFMPFFRIDQNHKGTGLGLSIAQEIVDLHQGQIYVESTLGEGSCFIVNLPTLPAEDF